MLRYIRLIQVISGLCLIWIYSIGPSFANDVPIPRLFHQWDPSSPVLIIDYQFIVVYCVTAFCITVVTEYLVVLAFLWWERKARVELFFWLLLVNLITNPASQIGVLFFAYGEPTLLSGYPGMVESSAFVWTMIGVIELVATTIEFGLMRAVFGRLYRRGAIEEPVSLKRTILIVLTANLASFVLGGIIGTVFAYEVMVG